VAVQSLEEPAQLFGQLLGLADNRKEEIEDQQVLTDIYNTGQGKIELLLPTSGDSPISKFLEKRGPGVHHIAFLVDDLRSWLRYLQQNGIDLIDKEPRIGAEGFQIAFIHPRSTAGVLVELCQKA
jgi:methylmalonyl-CoA/ethylmalonyl-CoA epimerase